MSENQKPSEQELKNDKQEVEVNDIPQELSEKEMKDVQGGRRTRGRLS